VRPLSKRYPIGTVITMIVQESDTCDGCIHRTHDGDCSANDSLDFPCHAECRADHKPAVLKLLDIIEPESKP
jgi:hypothetical protein